MFKKSALVGLLNLASTVLNFIWSLILASYFGASPVMDAYVVVINFINLTNNVFLKIQNNALIPFLFDFKQEETKREVIGEITRFSILFFSFLSVTVFFLSKPIIITLAPGLTPENADMANTLLKIVAPAMLFFSFIGLNNGLLEHQFKFAISSAIKFILNALALVILILIIDRYGIIGVPASFTAALLITAVISYINFRINRYSANIRKPFDWPLITRYMKIMAPLLFCIVVGEMVHLVEVFVASFLREGSISYLSYSYKLMIFIMIVSSTVITVIFPMLSKHSQAEDQTEFLTIFYKGFEALVFILMPLAAFTFIFAEPIVTLLYKRGAFTEQDASIVADTIRCYLYVFVGGPIGSFITYAFYSKKKSVQTIPLVIMTTGVSIVLNVIFSHFFMHYGIAASASIAVITGNIIFIRGLKIIVPDLKIKFLLIKTLKILLCSCLTGILLYLLSSYFIINLFQNAVMNLIAVLAAYSLIGLFVYGIFARMVKIDIQDYFLEQIRKMFK